EVVAAFHGRQRLDDKFTQAGAFGVEHRISLEECFGPRRSSTPSNPVVPCSQHPLYAHVRRRCQFFFGSPLRPSFPTGSSAFPHHLAGAPAMTQVLFPPPGGAYPPSSRGFSLFPRMSRCP